MNCRTYKGLLTPNKHLLPVKAKNILFNQAREKLLRKNNALEEQINRYLVDLGVRFIREKGVISEGNFCIFDFFLVKPYKVCIEVDGPSHDNEKQRGRDYYKDKVAEKFRWKILRIHHTNMPNSKEELMDRIRA